MRTLKLTLAYDGTNYAGWQVQPDEPTVQEALGKAIEKITGQAVRTLASGRTDAGVHALGQVVGFRTECRLDDATLRRALNALLPDDIAVLDVSPAPDGFHPIRDAHCKRYGYVIHDGPVRDVFSRRHCWHYRQGLDERAMHEAAQALLGKHDFSSFESSGAPRVSSVRTISHISVRRTTLPLPPGESLVGRVATRRDPGREGVHKPGHDPAYGAFAPSTPPPPPNAPPGDFLHVEVESDGFLYNMVRAIVGTLVEVGRGAEPVDWVRQVLLAANRNAAGQTAPPQGLFLMWVKYDGG